MKASRSFSPLGFLLAILLLLWPFGAAASGGAPAIPVSPGDVFPDVEFTCPLEDRESDYLGVERGKGFLLSDINAEIMIVELMSTYCQSCQLLVPIYDELYDRIEADAALRGRVKIINIALGNTPVEIKQFHEEHGGKFPLIADPDFKVLDAVGETRTPLSVFIRNTLEGMVVAATKLGYEPESEKLEAMLREALKADLTQLTGSTGEEVKLDVLSVISQEGLLELLRAGAAELGGEVTAVEALAAEGIDHLYSIRGKPGADERRLFAKVGSGVALCDVCHDVFFAYFFDRRGKILNIRAIQLSGYDNEAFDKADMDYIKRRLVGRYIFDPFRFDAKVDSITTATITVSAMFRVLDKSRTLFERMEAAGYLK